MLPLNQPALPEIAYPLPQSIFKNLFFMRRFFLLLALGAFFSSVSTQTSKVEMYDLLKKLLYDSTGYTNVGNWAVGRPKTYPVKWKADRIEMSNDTSINFYRQGTADITIKGKRFVNGGKPLTWNVLLKGPRMGYASFSIVSAASTELQPKMVIDSLLGKQPFKATLLKSCDKDPLTGFYYYAVKLPKKDLAYLRLSWITINGATAVRVDGYDSWSQYAAKLSCRN